MPGLPPNVIVVGGSRSECRMGFDVRKRRLHAQSQEIDRLFILGLLHLRAQRPDLCIQSPLRIAA